MRFLRLPVAIVLFFCALGLACNAGGITIDELLLRMENVDHTTTSVSFDFSQEIGYTLTKELQTNTGSAIFQKPDNLYLSQKKPLEQIIVANGKKVWIYTPAYKQVLVDNWKKWSESSLIPSSLTNFGQNYNDLKKKYTITLSGTEEKKYVLLLVPRTKEVWQLKLWIDEETFVPTKAVLYGDNVTVSTQLVNYKVNPPVQTKQFIFQAPPGVDVLRIE